MVEVRMDQSRNRASAFDGDKEIGYCTYEPDGNVLTVTHTVVEPEYGGQGLARKLMDEVVAFAREQGYKIVPVCSYVVHAFEKDASYADVWEKGE